MRHGFVKLVSLAAALCCAACGSESGDSGVDDLSREVFEPSGDDAPERARLLGMDPEEVLASNLCQEPQPGPAPLRRLSNAEYRNTLLDLIGNPDQVEIITASFPSETESLGFRNSADTLVVTRLVADHYQRAATALANVVVRDGDVMGCLTSNLRDSGREEECAQRFIKDFGQKVYRRPLTDTERDRYWQLFETGRDGGDLEDAAGWVVSAMFQSPNFLYRVEQTGEADEPEPADPHVLATRLAFLIWQSSPDAELLDAAETGGLRTREQVEQQARRMLSDEKAVRMLEFFRQWLDLDEMGSIKRDREFYPRLKPNLAELFAAESESFWRHVISEPDGSLTELLSAPYTFANAELAEHYRLENRPTSTSFVQVDAPGRAGILTQAMLTVHDRPTRTSIVRRGLKIRTDLLCHTVPAPPDNVDLTLDGLSPDLSQKERLEQHRVESTCAGCHTLMDPIGGVFEGFDSVGRPRTKDEYGAPVDSMGEIVGTRGIDGKVDGVVELAGRLAESDEVKECVMLQAFRFFYGRETQRADLCSQAQLMRRFRDTDYNIRELILGLTQTDAFLYAPAKISE